MTFVPGFGNSYGDAFGRNVPGVLVVTGADLKGVITVWNVGVRSLQVGSYFFPLLVKSL